MSTTKVGPAGTRRSTAALRRAAVIDAAVETFAAAGLRAPTTDIARRAGISQAYLFSLFPSKEDLVLAVSARVRERLLTKLGEAHAGSADHETTRPNSSRCADGLEDEDRDILTVQLMLYAASAGNERIREAQRRTLADLHALAAGQRYEPLAVNRVLAMGLLAAFGGNVD